MFTTTTALPTRGAPRRRHVALLTVAVVTVLGLFTAATAGAAQAPVGLGTATSFAVLAGAGITNTGATTITGDIGTYPTTSQTGFGTIVQTGVNHAGDAVTQQAKLDLVDAYNDAAARGPITAATPVDLAGQTLTPGVYSSGTIELSGTVALDAQGDPNAVFVFQAASTLVTASASTVSIINGTAETACNIFWEVGSSATLGSGSSFVGTLMAMQSISLGSTATVQGRMLARNGAVTMIANTITTPECPELAVTPTPTTAPPTTTGPTDGSAGSAGSDGSTSGATPGDGSSTGAGTPTGTPTELAFTGSDRLPLALGVTAVVLGTVCLMASRRRALASV
ncbi:MAG: ice-binding family protein [Microthrixaceae bacterium]